MEKIIIIISSYLAAQIFSDITSLKIVKLFGFSIDAGTFIYPITFTLRDLVHKVTGKRISRLVILIAAAINLSMAGLFWIVSKLPYALAAGPQPDWDGVLSPLWRIVVASIIAEVISELLDTEIYHIWVSKITTRYQWMRVLASNAISVPIDSLIFVWGAFGGLFPSTVIWSIFAANILLKGIVTILSMPMIYIVK